jgi:hypothetical protein
MNRPRLETTPRPALPACLLILATALTFGCSAEEQTVETVRLDAPPAQRDRQLEKLSSSDHVALLESCLSHYRPRVKDYTCTFSKQERMDGRLGARQLIDVRFREDPFSVAMTWRENPPRGDRVLYVEGRWDGKMLVRPTGVLARAIVPVAVRDPDGKEAMAETRRPVTMFGFKRSLQSLLDVYR